MRPLVRPTYRQEDNIKIDFKKQCKKVDWNSSDSAYGPMAGSCNHGNESSGFIKRE
jgi:hypothetical protein